MKLTESKLKKAPASKYMNTDQLDFFKEKLISQKIELSQHLDNVRNDIGKWENYLTDRMFRPLRRFKASESRESKLLPKIDEALKRIDDGSYGYCVNTGEPIGIERLLVRPTALFCAEEKNRQEKIEKAYRD